MQKYFEVGQIVNTFGINGTVKVKPFTDEIERFEELKNVLIDKNNKLIKCEIENVKYQKQMVLLKFKGLDLIGLNVFTEDGKLLGYLEDIYNAGSSDIYVVKTELGKQVLLPSIKEVIKQVDLENEKIIVHLLKGLVED